MCKARFLLKTVVLLSLATCVSVFADTSTFTPLQGPSGSLGIAAYDISDRGDIVGEYLTTSATGLTTVAFLYDGRGFTTLAVPGAQTTTPFGIAGNVVVGVYVMAAELNTVHGFRYEKGSYQTVDYPGTSYTFPQGVNQHGQIVGFYQDPTTLGLRGFIWERGSFQSIQYPGVDIVARGINDTGQVVGSVYTLNGPGSFIWANGTFTSIIPSIPVKVLQANRINRNGQIAGAFIGTDDVWHGFIIIDGQFQVINAPQARAQSFLTGLNDKGEVLGWFYVPGNPMSEFGAFGVTLPKK